jgi:hypothetical protein
MARHENAPDGTKRRKPGRSMEQLEDDLAEILGDPAMAEAAVRILRQRYWGQAPFVSESDSSGFMVRFCLCVAIAAAELGRGVEEAMEIGREATAAVKRRYRGCQVYISEVDPREARDKLIQAVYSDKTAPLLQRVTGLTRQNLLHVVRNGSTATRRRQDPVGFVKE